MRHRTGCLLASWLGASQPPVAPRSQIRFHPRSSTHRFRQHRRHRSIRTRGRPAACWSGRATRCGGSPVNGSAREPPTTRLPWLGRTGTARTGVSSEATRVCCGPVSDSPCQRPRRILTCPAELIQQRWPSPEGIRTLLRRRKHQRRTYRRRRRGVRLQPLGRPAAASNFDRHPAGNHPTTTKLPPIGSPWSAPATSHFRSPRGSRQRSGGGWSTTRTSSGRSQQPGKTYPSPTVSPAGSLSR